MALSIAASKPFSSLSPKFFDFLIYSKAMAADASVSVSFSNSATTASMSPRRRISTGKISTIAIIILRGAPF